MIGVLEVRPVDIAEGEGVALGPDAQLKTDAVHRDRALELDGEAFGHRLEGALRRRVADAPEPGVHGRARGDVDDAPLARLAHARAEVVDEIEGAVDVDVGGQPPALRGVFEGGAGDADGGVVDQQVAAAEALVDRVREGGDRLFVTNIQRGEQHLGALLAGELGGLVDGAGQLGGGVSGRAGADDEVVAAGGEVDGELLADAAAGAGDERNGFRHGASRPPLAAGRSWCTGRSRGSGAAAYPS